MAFITPTCRDVRLADTSSLEPFWQWAIGRSSFFYWDDHVA